LITILLIIVNIAASIVRGPISTTLLAANSRRLPHSPQAVAICWNAPQGGVLAVGGLSADHL